MKLNGLPILVIEVKRPHTDALANEYVNGQLCDYMCVLRQRYGVNEVFGIITTYDEWKVCWFKDTNEFAASRERTAKTGGEFYSRADFKKGMVIPLVFTCHRDVETEEIVVNPRIKAWTEKFDVESSEPGFVSADLIDLRNQSIKDTSPHHNSLELYRRIRNSWFHPQRSPLAACRRPSGQRW